jgi:hypothetical protein
VPYLGAGVDQTVTPAVTPTWVFTPTAKVTNTLRILNQGNSTIWLGGANVSPFNGFALLPGSRPLELQNAGKTVYLCSDITIGATGSALSTAPVAAGGSSFTVASSVAGYVAGASFVLGASGSQEVLTIKSVSADGTTIATTTNSLYDHVLSSPMTLVTTFLGQARITAGAH